MLCHLVWATEEDAHARAGLVLGNLPENVLPGWASPGQDDVRAHMASLAASHGILIEG